MRIVKLIDNGKDLSCYDGAVISRTMCQFVLTNVKNIIPLSNNAKFYNKDGLVSVEDLLACSRNEEPVYICSKLLAEIMDSLSESPFMYAAEVFNLLRILKYFSSVCFGHDSMLHFYFANGSNFMYSCNDSNIVGKIVKWRMLSDI